MKKVLFYVNAGFLCKIADTIVNRISFGGGYNFSLLSDAWIPWYMFAMAAFTLLCYMLREQNKIYFLLANVVLACFIGYDKSVGDYLYLSRIIVFFPFYLLGSMINPENITKMKERYEKAGIFAWIIIIAWGYICFAKLEQIYGYRPLFTGRNPFSDTQGWYSRLVCYGISAILSCAWIMIVPSCKIPFITSAGKKTLNIYFWHAVVLIIANGRMHLSNLMWYGAKGKLIILLISVITTVVLSFDVPFSFPMKQIRKAIFRAKK